MTQGGHIMKGESYTSNMPIRHLTEAGYIGSHNEGRCIHEKNVHPLVDGGGIWGGGSSRCTQSVCS